MKVALGGTSSIEKAFTIRNIQIIAEVLPSVASTPVDQFNDCFRTRATAESVSKQGSKTISIRCQRVAEGRWPQTTSFFLHSPCAISSNTNPGFLNRL